MANAVIDKQFNRRLPKRNVPVGHDEELHRGRKGASLEQTLGVIRHNCR